MMVLVILLMTIPFVLSDTSFFISNKVHSAGDTVGQFKLYHRLELLGQSKNRSLKRDDNYATEIASLSEVHYANDNVVNWLNVHSAFQSRKSARVKNSNYYLNENIFRGGHGEIWRAHRLSEVSSVDFTETFILKRMHVKDRPDILRCALREIYYGTMMRGDPRIAQYISFFQADSDYWLVFKDHGISLHQLLYARSHVLEEEETSKFSSHNILQQPSKLWRRLRTSKLGRESLKGIMYEIISGVADLHAVGTLHRDIKPSNILISSGSADETSNTDYDTNARVLISDFSSAVNYESLFGTDCSGEDNNWVGVGGRKGSAPMSSAGVMNERLESVAGGLFFWKQKLLHNISSTPKHRSRGQQRSTHCLEGMYHPHRRRTAKSSTSNSESVDENYKWQDFPVCPSVLEATLSYAPPEVLLRWNPKDTPYIDGAHGNKGGVENDTLHSNPSAESNSTSTACPYPEIPYDNNIPYSYDSWSLGVVFLEIILGTSDVFSVDQRTSAILSHKLRHNTTQDLSNALLLAALSEYCIYDRGQSSDMIRRNSRSNINSYSPAEKDLLHNVVSNDVLADNSRAGAVVGSPVGNLLVPGSVQVQGTDSIDNRSVELFVNEVDDSNAITPMNSSAANGSDIGLGLALPSVVSEKSGSDEAHETLLSLPVGNGRRNEEVPSPQRVKGIKGSGAHRKNGSPDSQGGPRCGKKDFQRAILRRDRLNLGFEESVDGEETGWGVDLLMKLLAYDPQNRISPAEALHHAYFVGRYESYYDYKEFGTQQERDVYDDSKRMAEFSQRAQSRPSTKSMDVTTFVGVSVPQNPHVSNPSDDDAINYKSTIGDSRGLVSIDSVGDVDNASCDTAGYSTVQATESLSRLLLPVSLVPAINETQAKVSIGPIASADAAHVHVPGAVGDCIDPLLVSQPLSDTRSASVPPVVVEDDLLDGRSWDDDQSNPLDGRQQKKVFHLSGESPASGISNFSCPVCGRVYNDWGSCHLHATSRQHGSHCPIPQEQLHMLPQCIAEPFPSHWHFDRSSGWCDVMGRRKTMEDMHRMAYSNTFRYTFFGVFDGHAGDYAARFAAENLFPILEQMLSNNSLRKVPLTVSNLDKHIGSVTLSSNKISTDYVINGNEKLVWRAGSANKPLNMLSLVDAWRFAFVRVNELLEKKLLGDVPNPTTSKQSSGVEGNVVASKSGTTATIAQWFEAEKLLVIAHVGDSRAILCCHPSNIGSNNDIRRGARGFMTPWVLTLDHTPYDNKERLRVEAANRRLELAKCLHRHGNDTLHSSCNIDNVIYTKSPNGCSRKTKNENQLLLRVGGQLAVTRSLGDVEFGSLVSPLPDVVILNMTDLQLPISKEDDNNTGVTHSWVHHELFDSWVDGHSPERQTHISSSKAMDSSLSYRRNTDYCHKYVLKRYELSGKSNPIREQLPFIYFLIIASDGLWDVMSNEEASQLVCEFVLNDLIDMTAKDQSGDFVTALLPLTTMHRAAELLVKQAYVRGSSDNIGVCVVDLIMN